MKESDWRSKLVKTFNILGLEPGMIWVNDVRYKAGWPDLYTVVGGRSSHYELKLLKDTEAPIIEDRMTQLQVAVCKRLNDAGASVYTMLNSPATNTVIIYSFRTRRYKRWFMVDFNHYWARGMSLDSLV